MWLGILANKTFYKTTIPYGRSRADSNERRERLLGLGLDPIRSEWHTAKERESCCGWLCVSEWGLYSASIRFGSHGAPADD